jgi:hypothetical protein
MVRPVWLPLGERLRLCTVLRSCGRGTSPELRRQRSSTISEGFVASALPQHQIHRPTPPHVRPRPAQVAQQLRVGAAGVLQGVGQEAKT